MKQRIAALRVLPFLVVDGCLHVFVERDEGLLVEHSCDEGVRFYFTEVVGKVGWFLLILCHLTTRTLGFKETSNAIEELTVVDVE